MLTDRPASRGVKRSFYIPLNLRRLIESVERLVGCG